VAVRARNAGVLFASCFDDEEHQRLKGLVGQTVALRVTPDGDVECAETQERAGLLESPEFASTPCGGALEALTQPRSSSGDKTQLAGWVISAEQFTPEIVGGKANNLNRLRGRLPDWIRVPNSIALPFGTFERVLTDEHNCVLREEMAALIPSIETQPAESLCRLRSLVERMEAPRELQASLAETWKRAGLPAVSWEQTWNAIRRVWASKWNDRAFFSRRARGVPHDSLQMAVLIQQVVPSDYAFVIHTANPLTGATNELFAEVVLGMGETLVGNYPGRALGFICRKNDLQSELLSYPSKSVGIYGKGVIFRSDSNGEDLQDFAGAGLYDSFLAETPEHRLLDYRGEKLVWDAAFREEMLRSIARIGLEVERLLGSAQDIEGAIAGGQFHVVQTRPQVGLSEDSLAA
jgi:alpha-glucan,water dikinase